MTDPLSRLIVRLRGTVISPVTRFVPLQIKFEVKLCLPQAIVVSGSPTTTFCQAK